MKCESNTIGAWLDDAYRKVGSDDPSLYGPIDWYSHYDGAVKVLTIAGFKINKIPCGKSMIHIVNPPDKIVKSDGGQLKFKLED